MEALCDVAYGKSPSIEGIYRMFHDIDAYHMFLIRIWFLALKSHENGTVWSQQIMHFIHRAQKPAIKADLIAGMDLSAEAYFLGKSDSSLLVSSSIRLQV